MKHSGMAPQRVNALLTITVPVRRYGLAVIYGAVTKTQHLPQQNAATTWEGTATLRISETQSQNLRRMVGFINDSAVDQYAAKGRRHHGSQAWRAFRHFVREGRLVGDVVSGKAAVA